MKLWLIEKQGQYNVVGYGPGAPTHLQAEGYTIICEAADEDASILDLVQDANGSRTVVNQAKKDARDASLLVKANDYRLLRESAYNSEGVDAKSMIVALWEKIVENRPEAIQQLQAKREAIKSKYPKN